LSFDGRFAKHPDLQSFELSASPFSLSSIPL
jgi:hypothetical protein